MENIEARAERSIQSLRRQASDWKTLKVEEIGVETLPCQALTGQRAPILIAAS